jgi:hypothetical protein
LEIASAALEIIGKGVRVCIEFSSMALDAGLISYGNPVLSIAGEDAGADTCLILTPEYSHNIFESKVHEIVCKPTFFSK